MSFDPEAARKNLLAMADDVIQEGKSKELVSLTIEEFLKRDFPPRTNLLAPWLPSQGLVQVYAYRGVGKTHFALGVAVAVASGGDFLKWSAPESKRVLYLDGEMPAVTIQERLSTIVQANDIEFDPGNLNIINPDLQEYGMPDLASFDGQDALKPYTDEADLIIVDNISTLCRAGAEDKADDWMIVQDWALRMRAAGKSVMFIHHAGKSGAQRGTSKREDVLDTVIALRHPVDYEQERGAEFEVHFEKARGITGDDVKPFVARLEAIDGHMDWTVTDLEKRNHLKVIQLTNDGWTGKEIAEELGINKSTVSRHLKRARAKVSL